MAWCSSARGTMHGRMIPMLSMQRRGRLPLQGRKGGEQLVQSYGCRSILMCSAVGLAAAAKVSVLSHLRPLGQPDAAHPALGILPRPAAAARPGVETSSWMGCWGIPVSAAPGGATALHVRGDSGAVTVTSLRVPGHPGSDPAGSGRGSVRSLARGGAGT
jgi:hypothetical protein